MSDKTDTEKAMEFQIESAERVGASCTTTKDGHTLIFKKDYLKKLLEKNPESDMIVIFVQRSDLKG